MTSIGVNSTSFAAERKQSETGLSHTAIAYGVGASVAVVFNTLLAWVKDSYPPLNAAMKQITGHHWITHGLAVVLVFFVVGFVLSRRSGDAIQGVYTPIVVLCGAVVIAGLGLAGWFLFN